MTGGTTLSAIAVLTNPRQINSGRGTKNLLFDGNLYVSDQHESPSLGLFRYFNNKDIVFGDEFTYAFVTIHMAKFDVNTPAEYRSADLNANDYAYEGDIVKMNIVKIPEAVDVEDNPYLTAYGSVVDADSKEDTFDMDPDQYTVIVKSNVECPLHCIIFDSPQWGEHKPKPQVGTNVTVGGSLEAVKRSADGEVLNFELSVESMIFLGRTTVPVQKKRNLSMGLPSAKKARYKYSDNPSQTKKIPIEKEEGVESEAKDDKKANRRGKGNLHASTSHD